MPPLDVNSFLVRGQTYTFSLKSSGWYRPNIDTVVSELQYISYISNVQVKLVGGLYGFFADQFDITFTYTGDGADTVGNAAGEMIAKMSVQLANFDYIGASGGSSGVPSEGTPGGGGPQLPSLPSNTTIGLIVVGLIVIAFLASGGASIVRRAAE